MGSVPPDPMGLRICSSMPPSSSLKIDRNCNLISTLRYAIATGDSPRSLALNFAARDSAARVPTAQLLQARLRQRARLVVHFVQRQVDELQCRHQREDDDAVDDPCGDRRGKVLQKRGISS